MDVSHFQRRQQGSKQFESFNATSLYCPKCRTAMPVREQLLLVLPGGGEIYNYTCKNCGESLGEKRIGDIT